MNRSADNHGNCFVFIRGHKRSEFKVASIGRRQKGDARSLSGVWPRKSARSLAFAYPRGTEQEFAETYLDHCAKYLARVCPLRVEVLLREKGADDEAVTAAKWSDITLTATDVVGIKCVQDLDETSSPPFEWALIFGTQRHWRDALDDVQAAGCEIRDNGLLRGFVNVPWGMVEVFETRHTGVFSRFAKSEWLEHRDEDQGYYPVE